MKELYLYSNGEKRRNITGMHLDLFESVEIVGERQSFPLKKYFLSAHGVSLCLFGTCNVSSI